MRNTCDETAPRCFKKWSIFLPEKLFCARGYEENVITMLTVHVYLPLWMRVGNRAEKKDGDIS
jgi:hypothetical protein